MSHKVRNKTGIFYCCDVGIQSEISIMHGLCNFQGFCMVYIIVNDDMHVNSERNFFIIDLIKLLGLHNTHMKG